MAHEIKKGGPKRLQGSCGLGLGLGSAGQLAARDHLRRLRYREIRGRYTGDTREIHVRFVTISAACLMGCVRVRARAGATVRVRVRIRVNLLDGVRVRRACVRRGLPQLDAVLLRRVMVMVGGRGRGRGRGSALSPKP